MKKTLLFQCLILSFVMLLIGCNKTEKVSTPTASPASGVVSIGTEVTLSCATQGASIYYSLDGSTPTSNSIPANAVPIVINSSVMIKAIAIKEGMDNSEILTVEYYVEVDSLFNMKLVEGGTFTMGCTSEQDGDCYSNERPAHSVTLSDFYIGETEVTQALWEAVMGNNPSDFVSIGANVAVNAVSWEDIVGTSSSEEGYTVNGVTYYQNGFCYKLSQLIGGNKQFRLPTEAEWEYAARGGSVAESQTKYSGSDNIDDVAWYLFNCDIQHEVKGKQSNALGLYDMTGNVSEWCSDWYGDYSSDSQTNPTGASTGSDRVYRGGGVLSTAEKCRVSFRLRYSPDDIDYFRGFRIAL